MARKQRSMGNRYSDRLCSQIAAIIHHNGDVMTAAMILEAHVSHWKNNPTRNELANYLGKSGYFVKHFPPDRNINVRGAVHIWGIEYEKCRARGWFEEPRQNRHVNDPLPLRE